MYDDPYRNYIDPRDPYPFGYDVAYPGDAAYYGAVQRAYPDYDLYGAAYRSMAQPYVAYSDYGQAYPDLYGQDHLGYGLNRGLDGGAEQFVMRDPYDAIGAAARLRGAHPFNPNPYDLGVAQNSRYAHAASGYGGNHFDIASSYAEHAARDPYGLANPSDPYAAQPLFSNRQSDPYNLPDSQYGTRNYGVGAAPAMADPFEVTGQDFGTDQYVYGGGVASASQASQASQPAHPTQSTQYQSNAAYQDSFTDQLEGYDIAEPPYFGMDYGADVPHFDQTSAQGFGNGQPQTQYQDQQQYQNQFQGQDISGQNLGQGQSYGQPQNQPIDPSASAPMQAMPDFQQAQQNQQNQVSMSGFGQQPMQDPHAGMSSMSGMQSDMQFGAQPDMQGTQAGTQGMQPDMHGAQSGMSQDMYGMQQNQFDPNAGFGMADMSGAQQMPGMQPGMQDMQGNPMMPGMHPDMQMPGAPQMGMQFGPDGQPLGMPTEAPGSALKCMIFGILSIIFSLIPPVGIVLGFLTRRSVKKFRMGGGIDGKANAANIFGLVGIILSGIILVLIIVFVVLLLTGSQFALGIANSYNQSPIGSLIKIPI